MYTHTHTRARARARARGEFFNLRLQNIWKNKHFQKKCFRQKLFGEVKEYH